MDIESIPWMSENCKASLQHLLRISRTANEIANQNDAVENDGGPRDENDGDGKSARRYPLCSRTILTAGSYLVPNATQDDEDNDWVEDSLDPERERTSAPAEQPTLSNSSEADICSCGRSENGDGGFVRCEGSCRKWYHLACYSVGINEAMEESFTFYCGSCDEYESSEAGQATDTAMAMGTRQGTERPAADDEQLGGAATTRTSPAQAPAEDEGLWTVAEIAFVIANYKTPLEFCRQWILDPGDVKGVRRVLRVVMETQENE